MSTARLTPNGMESGPLPAFFPTLAVDDTVAHRFFSRLQRVTKVDGEFVYVVDKETGEAKYRTWAGHCTKID